MLGSPARSCHGGAALVLVLAATLVAALPWAATPARAATVATVAGDTTVTPSVLEFGEMAPGTTQVRTATLTTGAGRRRRSSAPSRRVQVRSPAT